MDSFQTKQLLILDTLILDTLILDTLILDTLITLWIGPNIYCSFGLVHNPSASVANILLQLHI